MGACRWPGRSSWLGSTAAPNVRDAQAVWSERIESLGRQHFQQLVGAVESMASGIQHVGSVASRPAQRPRGHDWVVHASAGLRR